jgi:hypothetical protein
MMEFEGSQMQTSRIFLLASTVIAAPFVQAQTQTATAPVLQGSASAQSSAAPLRYAEPSAHRTRDNNGGRDRRDNDRQERDRRDREGRRGCDHNHNQPCNKCSTVIIGGGSYYAPGTVPVYPGYSSYPTYGYPNNYPSYPYTYAPPISGSSVTISTPGFSNGTFTAFPWSTTVTTFSNGYSSGTVITPGCGTGYYPSYPSYPAYPTYVPGAQVQGYRGAATPGYGAYGYNSGGLSVGYSNQRSSGYSTGFGHYSSRSSGVSIGIGR